VFPLRDRSDVCGSLEGFEEGFGVLGDGGENDVAVGLDAARVEVAVYLRGRKRISSVSKGARERGDAPAKRQPDPSVKAASDPERPRVSATIQCTNRNHE
jgi:hypothetical protein